MSDIIGIGTDITECLRIAKMIERHGEQFVDRVYTAEEVRYCQHRKQYIEHYTGRWCAKEAVLKALGTGWRKGIRWRDVEVVNLAGGKPTINLYCGALEVADRLGIDEIQISISHCRTHATAFAIAVGGSGIDI